MKLQKTIINSKETKNARRELDDARLNALSGASNLRGKKGSGERSRNAYETLRKSKAQDGLDLLVNNANTLAKRSTSKKSKMK